MTSRHIVIDARIRRSSTGRPIDELVNHLQDIDHQNRYTILVQPDDTWQMHAPNFSTLPCPFPQFSLNPLHELRFAWQLYRLKPDLIHFGMTQQPLLYFGNIVTYTHDLTMLYHVRKKATPKGPYWLRIRLYKFLLWWGHRKSKKIITFAHTTAKEIAALHPFAKDKLVVTYEAPGVPLDIKPVKPKQAFGTYIMYQGTAFPHKNLPKLIEAFDIVHEQFPKLNLVMVGKTEKHYLELQEDVKRQPSAKNIIFTGFLPDPESKWTFQHAQLYVTPTLIEGAGLTPLEAMANGAPVISSNTSVMPELYGKGALYCDPHDAKDIADKICLVLRDEKLRKALIAQGAAQVKKYSWEKMAKETLAVYNSLLKD
jgi:glycosyltransferase involved in cell wall biosynthesis